MRIALSILVLGLSAGIANASDYSYIQQKREQANKQRMYLLQQIQHKQSNPTAYFNKLGDSQPQVVKVKASPNGHFYLPGMVNGRSVNFIADTGASSIFLTQSDARKLGLNIQNLNYSKVYNTANGKVTAAETIVPSFKVGSIELTNVPVSVSSVPDGQSLLGMTFFSRLKSYGVQNGVLTLYK